MQREFYSRGKRRTVEQLEDFVAVKIPDGVRGIPKEELQKWGTIVTDQRADSDARLKLPDQGATAFESKGWLIVQPNQRLTNAIDTRELPPQIEEVRPVYRQASGRVVIGTDRLTTKLQPQLTQSEAEEILRARGLHIIQQLKHASNLYLVRIPESRDVFDIAKQLHEDANFVYAEPVFIEHIPKRAAPLDPEYGMQWQWNNIRAAAAWDHTRGRNVRIAVIDVGFDVEHEDLKDGIVDDSGYFEEVNSADVGSEVFRRTLVRFPVDDHGTFCAGIAAARQNNQKGGCGAAPEAELMLVASLERHTVGSQVTLARAVAYAADPTTEVDTASPANGADVISCSLGPNVADWELESVLEDAIEFAVTRGRGGKGTAVFWAVSNGYNVPIAADEVCALPTTIAVSRCNSDDSEDNAARGPELDFLAPGVNVHSTNPGNTYGTNKGTSFAAPCACGVAALVLSVNPNLTWQELRQLMRDTCDKVGNAPYDGTGHNPDYGYGRINAQRAVEQALQKSGPMSTISALAWLFPLLEDEMGETNT